MRKRTRDHHLVHEAFRMCLDDIKEIYDIMCQENQAVEISFDQYDFDDFEEFVNFARQYPSDRGFEFVSRGDRYARFDLSKNNVIFRCDNDGTYSHLKVEEIIKESVPAIYRFIQPKTFSYLFFMGLIITFIGLAFSQFLPSEYNSVFELAVGSVFLTTFGLVVLAYLLDIIYPRAKFDFVWKDERKGKTNFFSRNRDQILLQALSASFGAVCGSLLTYLLR